MMVEVAGIIGSTAADSFWIWSWQQVVEGGGQASQSGTGTEVDGGPSSPGRTEGIGASESMLKVGTV